MTAPTPKRLGEILIERGIITAAQLQEALDLQKKQGGALGEIVTRLGYAESADVAQAVGVQLGMEVINLDTIDVPQTMIERVSVTVAQTYRIIPVAIEDDVLLVAMADPGNIGALDDLRFFLDCEVRGCIADAEAWQRAFSKYYADQTESVTSIIHQMEQDDVRVPVTTTPTETIDLESIEEMADAAPVRKLLNLVLLQAIKDKASDIHFEPFEDEFKIRYRMDGVLYEMVPPPKHLALAIASRIKVMANMDIAERRRPQDGRIELNVGGNPIDLRISTLPTMFGESVVMRILDRSVVQLDLANLGMDDYTLNIFRTSIEQPQGIILVTGPTGSGKTTTLYAALREVNNVGVKIITVENPVEYSIEGLHQVNVNEEVGVAFANTLRHILRQDPDKILVGEIRDQETAEMAVQASLTGHIVFSTLHTNDAPTAITRLVDIGLAPFLITATLENVVSQRLVRKICEHCKERYEPTPEELMELGLTPAQVEGKEFYYGKGCSHCNSIGYQGRTGIFEIMRLDEELSAMVLREASTGEIRRAAIRKGMHSLRDAGLVAVYDGTTTIEEVVKATIDVEAA